jgi:ADP-dependent NAD(P)H-hydrate dehydratase / NAD(P)H-hydrate epimerase
VEFRTVRVTTAAQAAARDSAAIAAGIDGFTLMLQAGTVAAAEIVRSAADRLARGVDVLVGAGNNGGDGYVVAAQLARLGVPVRVCVAAAPRTADAMRADALARTRLPASAFQPLDHDVSPGASARGVVVDALLGTGATGALRGAVATGAAWCREAGQHGVPVFALDVPTGVDATTGSMQAEHVRADVTITFGTCKSGLLAARGACGRIIVADIGLGVHATLADEAGLLADADALRAIVPPIAWNAHKGTRGRVLIVGGADGMAGAVQFVARGALASGAGLVRAVVHAESARALQAATPAVVCAHADGLEDLVRQWAHVVVLGPGLGRDASSRAMMHRVLTACRHSDAFQTVTTVRARGSLAIGASARRPPTLVLDADALMLLASPTGISALRDLGQRVSVLLTPHAGEFAALAEACGVSFSAVLRDPAARAAAAVAVARATACTVLLKGAPTVCTASDGTVWYVPRGSATLATGGTGDVLAGVLGAVVASSRGDDGHGTPLVAHAALGAWVHGVAGERAGPARGTTIDDVVHVLRDAWRQLQAPGSHAPGVLAEVPSADP